jgi:hypothetical protein
MINNDFAWIGLTDITPILPLSPNTDEKEIKVYVLKAQEIDFANMVSENLFNAINEAVKGNIQQFKQGRTYQQDAKVFYNNAYYIAVEETTTNPEDPEFWTDYELMNFFYLYVKKWLATATVVRYLPFLGLHATQWGLEQYSQEGFGQVTDKRRGEMLNSYVSEASVYLSKMANELKRVNYTFDGVVYAQPCNKIQRKNPFTII